MPLLEDIPQPDNGFYVLVTGANSGLGLGIGTRLIDEFLQTRPQSESLVLIITTRSQSKGDATIEKLEAHLKKTCRKAERKMPGISMVLQRRVHFRQERLDLLSLISVLKLAKRLRETTPKLDAVICNAGIGGWTGIDWWKLAWKLVIGWKTYTTWPTFKISGVGWLAKPQVPASENGKKVEEPPLGEVFCANFFGHYLLGHYLAPLLAKHDKSENTRGRIIWVSSLEAYKHAFDINDIQAITADQPYEAGKRLSDLMAITSALPSTAPLVDKYLDYERPAEHTTKPRIYTTHPGICGTSIVPLVLVLEYAMFLAFYISRWFGSQWHLVTPEKGATAMVWVALAKQSTLDAMEEREGIGKWGSAIDRWGNERVERTEMEGWGWTGTVGEKPKKGRSPFATDLTEQDRKEFVELGKKCWEEIEALRIDWEMRLDEAGVSVKMD